MYYLILKKMKKNSFDHNEFTALFYQDAQEDSGDSEGYIYKVRQNYFYHFGPDWIEAKGKNRQF